MEIMKLKPAGKDYLWGGIRLKEEFGKSLNMTPLAETWECSVHPDGLSTVENGSFIGLSLAQVLKLHPEYLGAKVSGDQTLPILVKLIDAAQDLSVQVHPSDAYARTHEQDNGKTEMWYVIDAETDASLIYGFEHPVTKEILTSAISDGTLAKHLHKEQVQKGDCFFVPPGTVHGIGAGTLIAEIQESSNVTYRVYDYDRMDKNGRHRSLHIEKAFEVMDMQPAKPLRQKQRTVHYTPGCSRELLCRCPYFEVERFRASKGFSFSVLSESFQILLCLDGEGQIESIQDAEKPVVFQQGDCLFLPANTGKYFVLGNTELLKIRC